MFISLHTKGQRETVHVSVATQVTPPARMSRLRETCHRARKQRKQVAHQNP